MQKTHFDIAIVGGGIMGLATLYHIATRTDLSVALFEQGRLGGGSTHKSGGFVRAFHANPQEIEWSVQTLRFLRQYQSETAFNPIGCFYLADGIDSNAVGQALETMTQLGEKVDACSEQEIVTYLPQLQHQARKTVIHEPNAGFADPLKTSLLYAELAKQAGATIFECAQITDIEQTHIEQNDIAADSPLTLHINGSETPITAKAVSINLGAWSPEFLHKLGLPSDVFKKGIQADTYLVNEEDFPPFCVLDYQTDIYTRPFGHQQQLIGIATQKFDVDLHHHHQSDPAQQAACLTQLNTLMNPQQDKPVALGGRIGFDGYSKDFRGKIYLSKAIPNLCISEGWSGAGFKMAHGAGEHTMKTLLSAISAI
ncbi:FAD-binding oxidoreductase [Paraneptunicella aestuarii]|uniref:NAD(P)/FAD-dependent oxidoreductase n=1 Tax=Paraneptunicella aestuarii TaxID=2831148 RepID=UPI001E311F23|nr:FAD-dependent oxidoreductase [Paraneptunicella aestuarii]UAA38025.1 FAD-binding oxidoreductase [Paraneptunicella aestuarii]